MPGKEIAADDQQFAAFDVGRQYRQGHAQLLESFHRQEFGDELGDFFAVDQPGGGDDRVDQSSHLLPVDIARHLFHPRQRHPGGVEGADEGTDGGAGDTADRNAFGFKHLEHADVRQSPGGPAAEGQADRIVRNRGGGHRQRLSGRRRLKDWVIIGAAPALGKGRQRRKIQKSRERMRETSRLVARGK